MTICNFSSVMTLLLDPQYRLKQAELFEDLFASALEYRRKENPGYEFYASDMSNWKNGKAIPPRWLMDYYNNKPNAREIMITDVEIAMEKCKTLENLIKELDELVKNDNVIGEFQRNEIRANAPYAEKNERYALIADYRKNRRRLCGCFRCFRLKVYGYSGCCNG